ncbi:MAG TPA: helix-turn-helix transcriptional regulator [Allosphingosinicella sp.]|jgi:DNA-binding PadR family transcriptional regulator
MPRRPHRSSQAAALFGALLARVDAWRHGYALMLETGLASGTLYPLLMRLADEGLLEAEWRPPVPPARAPRHAYRLTARGRAFAHARLAEAGTAAKRRGEVAV